MKARRLRDSFKYALDGFLYAFRTQRNMKIHTATAVAVIVLGNLLSVSRSDMGLLLFSIGLVLALEMINTAIETIVDMITEEFHPKALIAKNVAAGAVFVAALTAAAIGIYVFYRPAVECIRNLYN